MLTALLAIAFGTAGWAIAIYDGSFRSVVDIVSRVVSSFAPSSQAPQGGNWATRVGGLFALLTLVASGIAIGLAIAGEQLLRALNQFVWTGHTIVVGDTTFARKAAEEFRNAGEKVFQVVPLSAPKLIQDGSLRLRAATERTTVVAMVRPEHARHLVIDAGEDAITLMLGNAVVERVRNSPKRFGGLRRLTLRGENALQVLALRLHGRLLVDELVNESVLPRKSSIRPSIFDENRLIARYTLARHPLFPVAVGRRQSRVHALVIGFDSLGECVMDQILLTSPAVDLGNPRVTVIDAQAERRRREFSARRPNVLEQLEIDFIQHDLIADPIEDGADD